MDSLSDKKILNQTTTPAYFAGSLLTNVRVDNTPNAQLRDASGKTYAMPADRSAFLKFVAKWEAKAKSTSKLGLATLLLIPLAACGGSSGSGTAAAPVVKTGASGDYRVFDGAIKGATVWKDTNGNGVQDANEPGVLTAADGSFDMSKLDGYSGTLTTTGGVDVVTGKSYAGITMTTTAGSKIISPITTMIQKIADASTVGTAEQRIKAAETQVQAALGLGTDTATKKVDLLKFDATTTTNTKLGNEVIAAGQAVVMALDMLTGIGGMSYAKALEAVAAKIGAGGNDITSVATLKSLLEGSTNGKVAGEKGISAGEAAAIATKVASNIAKMQDAVETKGYTSASAVTAFKTADTYNNSQAAKDLMAGKTGVKDAAGKDLTTADLADGTKVAANFDALIKAGHNAFTITNGSLKLTVAQAVKVSIKNSDNISIQDTAANITAGDAKIASSGIETLVVKDNKDIELTAKTASDLDLITTIGKVTIKDAATVEQLTKIDAITTVTPVYTQITDIAKNIFTTVDGVTGSILNSNAAVIKGKVNVTVTDAVTVEQIKAINANTTGDLTYSIKDTAAKLAASGSDGNDATNVAATGVATIAQAKAILALTNSGTTSYKVTGKLVDLIKADLAVLKGASEVIYTDYTSAADYNKLLALVGNVLTNGDKKLSDNIENLLADSDLGTSVDVTVTGGNMTIAQLTKLDAKNGDTGSVDITGGTIKDTAANLAKDANLKAADGTTPKPAYIDKADTTKVKVEVTDLATINQLKEITGDMDGSAAVKVKQLSYKGVSDTAEELAKDIATNGGAGTYVSAGTYVNLKGTATINQLIAIDKANGSGLLKYGSVTGSITDLEVGGNANIAPKIAEATKVAASSVTQESTITFTQNDASDVFTVKIGNTSYTYAARANTDTAETISNAIKALILADTASVVNVAVTGTGAGAKLVLTAKTSGKAFNLETTAANAVASTDNTQAITGLEATAAKNVVTVDVAQISKVVFGTIAIGDIFTVTIAGTDYTVTAAATTAASITALLVTAINAGSGAVTASTNTAGALILTADIAGTAFTVVKTTANATGNTTPINHTATITEVTANSTIAGAIKEVSTVTFSGKIDAGDIFTMTLAGVKFTHVAIAGKLNASDITDAFTALINASKEAAIDGKITANNKAGVLTLTAETAGTTGSFTLTALTATNVNAGTVGETATISHAAGTQQVKTVTFTGAIDLGDKFSVTIDGIAYEYMATTTTTSLGDVAAGLRDVINKGTGDVTAAANGGVLTLTHDDVFSTFTLKSTATNADYIKGHDLVVTGSATLTQLAALDAKNGSSNSVSVSKDTIISGTADDIIANTGKYITSATKINITDTGSITHTQLRVILDMTTGTVTAEQFGGQNINIIVASGKTFTGTAAEYTTANLTFIMADKTSNVNITDKSEAGNINIIGTAGNDTLTSGDAAGVSITGGAGNDILHGGDGGTNTLNGGAGNDILHGGDGDGNTIAGDIGNDIINGGKGNELLAGGTGADIINASAGGYDTIYIPKTYLNDNRDAAGSDAAFTKTGDIIRGLINGDGGATSDKVDLWTNPGAIKAEAKLDAVDAMTFVGVNTVLVHETHMANEWVSGNTINIDNMTAALKVIQTTDAVKTHGSEGFILIFGKDSAATTDIALFYVKDSNNNGTFDANEIHFINVLEDFGTTMTNGFIT